MVLQLRTGLGVHGEVRLALQDAVDHTRAVAICGVVGVCSGQLYHRCSWKQRLGGDDASYKREAVLSICGHELTLLICFKVCL